MRRANRGVGFLLNNVLPPRLRNSLLAVHGVAAATLLRSVFYDRWITVLASLVLILGAAAALRGKTWGIGVALGAAISFPVAWAIGIAPPWFCLVGLIGALPFALTSKSIARFDATAAAIGAALAAAVGAGAAMGFREIAPYVFTNFPSLRPSAEANHFGLAIAMMAITTLVVAKRSFSGGASNAISTSTSNGAIASDVHARIELDAAPTRIADSLDHDESNATEASDESLGKTSRS